MMPLLCIFFYCLQFDDAYVVYAWHEQDPASPDEVMQHTNQGTKMVNLMEETPKVQLPPDAIEFRISVNNVSGKCFFYF